MATTKKTTKTNATKKTNDSKAKKTNNTKKIEEPNVVNEFLDTVVGETMTQEDADNNENRKKEIKERLEKLGMDEGMQEEVKESVADMYVKQSGELIKEAEENEPECLHHIDAEEELTEILTQQINTNEPNEAEKQFNELFEEKKEPEQPVNTNPQIVYVSTAMGASWD